MSLTNFKNADLTINNINTTYIPKQYASEGDYLGRTLTVQITDDGLIGRIDGAQLVLHWKNIASGLSDDSAFTLIDAENAIFRIEYPTNMMTPGTVKANILVIYQGKTTVSREFEITVANVAGQSTGVLAKAEFSALVAALSASNKWETRLSTVEKEKMDSSDVASQLSSKADKAFVDAQFASIVSGTPKGTFATLSALQTAYPSGTEGVFLVLENGHWYYYASGWKDGGVYQATSSGNERALSNLTGLASDSNSLVTVVNSGDKYTITFVTQTGYSYVRGELGLWNDLINKKIRIAIASENESLSGLELIVSDKPDWSGNKKIYPVNEIGNGWITDITVNENELGFSSNYLYVLVRDSSGLNLGVNVTFTILDIMLQDTILDDTAAFSVTSYQSTHAVHASESYKSKIAERVLNAGTIQKISKVRVNTSANCAYREINNQQFMFSKGTTPSDRNFFPAIWFYINYDTFDELDFYLNINIEATDTNSPVANKLYILKTPADWLNDNYPIELQLGEEYNLKKAIESSAYQNYYTSAKQLIISCAYTGNNNDILNNIITVNTYNDTMYVYANDLRLKTKNKIIDDIKEDVVDIKNEIVCWGDSLTAMGGWTDVLSTKTGLPVINAGQGGEDVYSIVARQGGDTMVVDNLVIPSTTTEFMLAGNEGIKTYLGHYAHVVGQDNGAKVNPIIIDGIPLSLFKKDELFYAARKTPGVEKTINRTTSILTRYEREHSNPYLMTIFMGQNGGYANVEELVNLHRLMLEHSKSKYQLILGMHTGTTESRANYEQAMLTAFGRKFFSLRQYLAHPVYDLDDTTIKTCWGLQDVGLTPTADDLAKIAVGQVPLPLMADGTHFTDATKTAIGNAIYSYLVGLSIF